MHMLECDRSACCSPPPPPPSSSLSLSHTHTHHNTLVMQIKRWCFDPDFCQKMAGHWHDRDHWLNGTGWWPRKEIWDGSRFSDLSWFWDPQQEWLLPVKCTECSAIIGVSQIKEQLCSGTQQQVPGYYIVATVQAEQLTIIAGAVQVEVSCGECHHSFQHTPQYARGDPRNIALIRHWDGFKPFRSTGQHSCGMYT